MTIKNGKRQTGEVLPRNYGLRLSMPRSMPDVFVSPTAYALAQVMLESPAEIRSRIRDWSLRHGEDYGSVQEAFVKGVVKRENSKNLLNFARRTQERQVHELVLRNMEHQGPMFVGEVKSKNRGYYQFSLPEPIENRDVNISYPGARVLTKDNLWNEGKGKNMSVIGVHSAVPEIALFIDAYFPRAQGENITGLSPKDRRMKNPTPRLPFTFNFFKPLDSMSRSELIRHQVVTDLVLDYYLKGISQYQSSINALQNLEVFSPELIHAITDHRDLAQFKVIRQKEEELDRDELSHEKDRRYAAVTTLVERIREYIESYPGYHFAGYGGEFVGTPWEAVARRFEPAGRGPVYSIVTSENHPPILVKKDLGHKQRNWGWLDSSDPIQTRSLTEKINKRYNAVDDVTRRESEIEIILPDKTLSEKGIYIPENLQDEYRTLRNQGNIDLEGKK